MFQLLAFFSRGIALPFLIFWGVLFYTGFRFINWDSSMRYVLAPGEILIWFSFLMGFFARCGDPEARGKFMSGLGMLLLGGAIGFHIYCLIEGVPLYAEDLFFRLRMLVTTALGL